MGTAAGAASVFFLRNKMSDKLLTIMMGFTSGIMMAAAVWSLLLPAIDMSSSMGKFAFLPASGGFLGGVFFLLLLDRVIPHIHARTNQKEGPDSQLKKVTMMVLAVTLHNVPEGMAVGVVFSNCMTGEGAVVTMAGAFLLAVGIALQNIPEGAIISVPLRGFAGKEPLGMACCLGWWNLSGRCLLFFSQNRSRIFSRFCWHLPQGQWYLSSLKSWFRNLRGEKIRIWGRSVSRWDLRL